MTLTDPFALSPEAGYFAGVSDLRSHLAPIESPDFWRQLNPNLTITDTPFAGRRSSFEFSTRDIERSQLQIREDGYIHTEPGVPADHCRALATAVRRIIEAKHHPLFLAVYDEYWRVWPGLAPLLTPILGKDYRVLGNIWVWCISDQTAKAGWTPHRDHQFSGREVVRDDGRPTILTVWIPITDATPLNGCMYILPLSRDPNFPDRPMAFDPGCLQNVRALPARAGSVLGWNQFPLHWGGAASKWADGPRMSIGLYAQSADVPLFTDNPVDFDRALPFAKRLAHIASNMLRHKRPNFFPAELTEIASSWRG